MSFFPDCSRSIKKLSHGKKLLAQVKELDIPGKSTKRNGFTVKATQLGGIEKITIKAPAGMVVLCSQSDKITSYCSEYWLDALSDGSDMHTVVPFPPIITEYPYAREYEFMVFLGDTPTGNVIANPDSIAGRSNCNPAIMPLYDSEALIYGLSYMQDLSGIPFNTEPDFSGTWYSNNFRTETFVDSYGGNGSIEYRMGTITAEDYVDYAISWTTQFLLNNKSVQFYGSNRLMFNNKSQWITALAWITEIKSPRTITSRVLLPSAAWGGVPSQVYFALETYDSQQDNHLYTRIIGSYAYTDPTTGLLKVLTALMNTPIADNRTFQYYWNEDNTERKETRMWKIFYTLYTEGREATETSPAVPESSIVVSGYTFSGGHSVPGYGIIPALSAIHGVPNQSDESVMNLTFIEKAMAQLLPFPNVNHYSQIPHDSVMFHSPSGIYAWTRSNGCVKFGENALEIVEINVPDEVSIENGVRPLITYGGTVDGVDTYLCICDRVTVNVAALYVGSPFVSDGWVALPMPAGLELLYVRPATVSPTKVILFGVVRSIETEKFYAAFLNLRDGVGEWQTLAEVSAPDGNHSWCLSLYGNEDVATMMRLYPSPPAATVQPYYLPSYPAVTYP